MEDFHRIYHENEKELTRRIDTLLIVRQHPVNNTNYQPLLPVA